MANQPELDQWDAGVYQLEQTDPVLAGLGGVSNKPLLNLANRTKYLYQRIQEMLGVAKAYAAATGTANAVIAAYTPAVTTLTDGMVLRFKGAQANTGATTFTPNQGNVAPSPIYGLDHAALTGGEIVVNGQCAIQWNASINGGAGAWVLIENGAGIRKGVTPAQFDATTKVATMEALQRAMGSMRGVQGYSASTTLTAADIGKLISTSATCTLTLPDATTIPAGSVIPIYSGSGGYTTTVTSPNGAMGGSGSNGTATIVQGSGVLNQYVSTGTGWFVIGAGGAASLAANGYQKLPSGLIIQWGQLNGSSTGVKSVSYPIAFPNAFLSLSLTCANPAAYVAVTDGAPASTLFTFSAWSVGSSPARSTASVFWVAIGY